ncbi:non-receptor serine/threonine protein kinase [Lithospermum erythrorhizon]|uniref:Non-receptor serine/threonine protein kinase n=1 Tax=Lithospermum erythrorhizon TaxID=34254 RepID=A0AAV3P704_LITER
MALKLAWFRKEEEKELQELSKPIDFDACKIDCQKLKVKKNIDKGAYGSVYQGMYDDKKVAVKVFHVSAVEEDSKFELRKSFLQEVCLSKDLDHPNIAKFIGAMENMKEVDMKPKKRFDKSQDCCIVSEFLSRGTLYQYLRRHKKLSINIVTQLALDAAEGLSYLHSKQIIHRDLKTANMLLDKNGRVKIIDFGISRFDDLNEKTQDIGTIGYIAPEVRTGSKYDHKCDVFSFGICLWEIFCCSAYRFAGLKMTPEIPQNCPKALADLMKNCWDDPKRRPEMSVVVGRLREFEASSLNESAKGPTRLLCFSR